jgi:hypothetical protein
LSTFVETYSLAIFEANFPSQFIILIQYYSSLLISSLKSAGSFSLDSLEDISPFNMFLKIISSSFHCLSLLCVNPSSFFFFFFVFSFYFELGFYVVRVLIETKYNLIDSIGEILNKSWIIVSQGVENTNSSSANSLETSESSNRFFSLGISCTEHIMNLLCILSFSGFFFINYICL